LRITAEILQDKLKAGLQPLIIDTRTKMEYQSGHVPGAFHLPFYRALFQASSVTDDKSKTVVIYCEHGPRAYIAGLGFILAGFKEITYLKGHMHNWRSHDFPME